MIKEATDLAKEPGLATPYVVGEQPEAQVTKGRLDSTLEGGEILFHPHLTSPVRGEESQVRSLFRPFS